MEGLLAKTISQDSLLLSAVPVHVPLLPDIMNNGIN